MIIFIKQSLHYKIYTLTTLSYVIWVFV